MRPAHAHESDILWLLLEETLPSKNPGEIVPGPVRAQNYTWRKPLRIWSWFDIASCDGRAKKGYETSVTYLDLRSYLMGFLSTIVTNIKAVDIMFRYTKTKSGFKMLPNGSEEGCADVIICTYVFLFFLSCNYHSIDFL